MQVLRGERPDLCPPCAFHVVFDFWGRFSLAPIPHCEDPACRKTPKLFTPPISDGLIFLLDKEPHYQKKSNSLKWRGDAPEHRAGTGVPTAMHPLRCEELLGSNAPHTAPHQQLANTGAIGERGE